MRQGHFLSAETRKTNTGHVFGQQKETSEPRKKTYIHVENMQNSPHSSSLCVGYKTFLRHTV